jgi:site-specific recombinase XerD
MAAQAISFFCRHVLKRPYVIPSVIYPRPTSKLTDAMLPEEVVAVMDSLPNIKHRTIVMLLYSSGLRVSEISNLKIADIDSKNMRIRVVQGKGGKDRYTILSNKVLLELRAYWLVYKPQEYLFNGISKGSPMSVRNIQHLVQKAVAEAGLADKNYSVHTIRHSFATHLVDNGTDLHTVKELLGHSSIQTTLRYLHISPKRLSGIVNPFDKLPTSKSSDNISGIQ